MNSHIETAIISNLQATFPSARIFTGKVVQGILPHDIIVNTIFDNVNIFRGSNYRQREVTFSVTYISPTDDVTDLLVDALKEFTANDVTHYPDNLSFEVSDDTVQVLVELTHLER